jgi:hypothetical protein
MANWKKEARHGALILFGAAGSMKTTHSTASCPSKTRTGNPMSIYCERQ